MLQSRVVGWAFALGIAFGSLTACSTASAPGCNPNDSSCVADSGADAGPAKPNDGGTDGGNADASPSGGDGGPVGEAACGANVSADDCYDCCYDFHSAGATLRDNLFDDCACATPGPCKTQCAATYCAQSEADPTPGDACDTCLLAAEKSDCGMASDTGCSKNPDCAALTACVNQQRCDSKP